MRLMVLMACVLGAIPAMAREPTVVRVGLDPALAHQLGDQPVAGRLVVYLISKDGPARADPADGPFFNNPQPMFSVALTALTGPDGDSPSALVDDHATSFPAPLSELPAGRYRVQAVLDRFHHNSAWQREPGNLFSKVATIDLPSAKPIELTLTEVVQARPPIERKGVRSFTVHSKLLSDFRGEPVTMRAMAVLPNAYDPKRRYAAVYQIPGFGGDDRSALRIARQRAQLAGKSGPQADLARACVWIVLDPEGPNGHHLFADSANNGPVGRALVEELIPAIEAQLPLVDDPFARLLRGHSSGGWSAIWLAIEYPETFGGAWASSPDPVDFHAFQVVNIYGSGTRDHPANMYFAAPGAPDPKPWPSYVRKGVTLMTIQAENAMEQVLGPDNTSAQQWDSWQAVFGPRNERGHPAALYDPISGAIDPAIVRAYRRYDIADRVRHNPGLALIFRQRIRLICGAEDNFALNLAVHRLAEVLDQTSFLHYPEGGHGYTTLVPGVDHSTIFNSDAMRAFPSDMLEHLRRHGLAGGSAGDD